MRASTCICTCITIIIRACGLIHCIRFGLFAYCYSVRFYLFSRYPYLVVYNNKKLVNLTEILVAK